MPNIQGAMNDERSRESTRSIQMKDAREPHKPSAEGGQREEKPEDDPEGAHAARDVSRVDAVAHYFRALLPSNNLLVFSHFFSHLEHSLS